MDTATSYVDVLSAIAAGFLSLVFVRALLHKLGGFAEFTGNVRDYRLVPESTIPFVAATLVVAEALTAIGLILPATRTAAAYGAAGLLAMYGAAIGINLIRGRTSIDCGCGGGGQGISPLHVLRNSLLMLFAVPAVAYQGAPPSGLGVSVAAAGCVFVLWITFVTFDQLLGNRTHAVTTTYSAL